MCHSFNLPHNVIYHSLLGNKRFESFVAAFHPAILHVYRLRCLLLGNLGCKATVTRHVPHVLQHACKLLIKLIVKFYLGFSFGLACMQEFVEGAGNAGVVLISIGTIATFGMTRQIRSHDCRSWPCCLIAIMMTFL